MELNWNIAHISISLAFRQPQCVCLYPLILYKLWLRNTITKVLFFFFSFFSLKTVQISYQDIPPSGHYITFHLGLALSLRFGTICVPGLCKQVLEKQKTGLDDKNSTKTIPSRILDIIPSST